GGGRRGSGCLARVRAILGAGRAEADGNGDRQTEMLDLTGFEDRGDHQEPKRLHAQRSLAGADADEPGAGPRDECVATDAHDSVTTLTVVAARRAECGP